MKTSTNDQVTYCSGAPGCATGAEQIAVQPNSAGGHFLYKGSQQIASIAAAAAVPEPATWTLMIAAFAGLGFATGAKWPRKSFRARTDTPHAVFTARTFA